jgi:FkbM family methyltransferase
MFIKNIIKSIFRKLNVDLTKNMEYDRFSEKIMRKILQHDSNCIDIGCHKGEMLELMLTYAPNGNHYAFEPIPFLQDLLNYKYGSKAQIMRYALSDRNGFSSFQYVRNAPAYSGIKQRKYDISKPEIEEISVELKRLDDIIPPEVKINFMKVDVEGGEFDVFKGAFRILSTDKPLVIFEFGKGAGDYYGTTPSALYDFLINAGLNISTLKAYFYNKSPLKAQEFDDCFQTNREYYFVAHPARNEHK